MRPTDDERRVVARRLREGMENRDDGFLDVVESAVFGDDLYHSSESTLERLADLIDPDTIPAKQDKTEHPLSEPEIDREALLALADELEEDACWEVQTPGDTSGAWRLKDACDRIREALGVRDG